MREVMVEVPKTKWTDIGGQVLERESWLLYAILTIRILTAATAIATITI
jgi:SpoVK/Ycf46/Vps4 family AAA+-type ATPase